MPEDSEGGGSFLRGGGAGGGRGVMNIRYHWSSSPTAALASHCRPPCFHLALVTHHPVILLVLSLSLSVSPHPPAPPTSLFRNSPLKPRVLQAISWGQLFFLSCPERAQQVISQAEPPLRGILLSAFITATVVLFSSHST